MKKILFISLFLIISNLIYSQNLFKVNVNGIKENDSVMVILQKSSAIKLQKWVNYSVTGISAVDFSLDSGEWSLIIDATGYTFPSSTVINIPVDSESTVTLTSLPEGDYSYQWEDDDSYAGHATQVYVNEPPNLVILNDTILVPNDYSSVKLRNEFGIVLSNNKSHWSSEDSYRLYTALKSLPITPFSVGLIDFSNGTNVQSIFSLTQEEQYRDLTIEEKGGIKYVTITQSAFTYSNPQIVTLDGIKGKFYSKRLYKAIVNYYTDFASNDDKVNQIAKEKFGIRFMIPNQETEDIMNEDASNFQEFFDEEKVEILSMFEEMPEGFHKIEGLKYLVRRINGQVDPIMPEAVALAFSGRNTIEFMSTAFNGVNIEEIRRIILHEKTHFLWAFTFDEQTKNDWIELGGWFLDPTSDSGWSTSNTTEFVSAYAHDVSPNEDMAESVAAYITNPDILLSRSVRKYEFIRDRIMHGTRYISQIREDLTFTVYNLFPDYTYPGKVIKVEIDVKGDPEEDKEVTIKVKLHSTDLEKDGANNVYIRLQSLIGTTHDISLTPLSGNPLDSILVGKTTFSKFEKSGYWNLAFLRVFDLVANQRNENTTTIGFKLFLDNPLEDIVPPKWNYDLTMKVVNGKFFPNNTTYPDENGIQMNAIKVNYSIYDDIPVGSSVRAFNPTLDDPDDQVYERWIQSTVIINDSLDNGYKKDKYLEDYIAVPNYFPSGYYSISHVINYDIARNNSWVYFVKDTSDFHSNDDVFVFKDVRDSVYVETLYPDYIAPEIDVNNINITADPINPTSPDGETRVDIYILARDLSDFENKESGILGVDLTLRDPLGNLHGYNTGNSTMNHPQLDETRSDFMPDNNSDWRSLSFNFLLPKGSPPGKWGISSMQITDKAGNRRNYSFVEYIRFDVIESDIQLTVPLSSEILDKVVNTINVEQIEVAMSCSPCQGKNYVYTVYSLMGGSVVRGKGVFSSDSINQTLNLSGILDGVIKLTVQVTDENNQLMATVTTDYTKDTVLPNTISTIPSDNQTGVISSDLQILFSEPVQKGTGDITIKRVIDDVVLGVIPISDEDVVIDDFNTVHINPSFTLPSDTDLYIEMTNLNFSDLNENPFQGYTSSTSWNFSTGTVLGIDTNFIKGFIMYPNPVYDLLNINSQEVIKNVKVFNLLGQQVFQKEINKTTSTLDLSSLTQGVYFVNITTDKTTKSVKIQKK